MNIHKGSLKVIFKRKFALNSPNLCITLKKTKQNKTKQNKKEREKGGKLNWSDHV